MKLHQASDVMFEGMEKIEFEQGRRLNWKNLSTDLVSYLISKKNSEKEYPSVGLDSEQGNNAGLLDEVFSTEHARKK
jgi:hypothetical protein